MKRKLTATAVILILLCVFVLAFTACNYDSKEVFNVAKQVMNKYDYLLDDFYEITLTDVEYAADYDTDDNVDAYCFKVKYKYKYSSYSSEKSDVFYCLVLCRNSVVTASEIATSSTYNNFCIKMADKTGELTKQQIKKLR